MALVFLGTISQQEIGHGFASLYWGKLSRRAGNRMFRVKDRKTSRLHRGAVVAILTMSAAALSITVWELYDFSREQILVEELITKLPVEENEAAKFLSGELRWQFRLTILVVLNVIATGIAIVLLWRAYQTSQESLRDIKTLAGDILSCMDQALITTDLAGTVTSINERGLEMLKTTVDCVGLPLTELSSTVPLNAFRIEWSSGVPKTVGRNFTVQSNGVDRVFRGFCQTLTDIDNNATGHVLQLRDVTNQVLVEDRMRRMERYLGLGSLAAGLHHEIKNPLAALSLHAQLLEEELNVSAPTDEVRRMLNVIKTEMQRVGGVLEGFRDFASVERLNISPVDIRELLRQQSELISPQAKKQAVEVQCLCPDGLLNEIDGDQGRLEQVLLNVLINALEAMPNGGRLLLTAESDSDSLVIKVADTGTGIPSDLRDKILDPYFTTKSKGTGLGLALCDKILRQHGGSLDFDTAESGTTCRITLPMTQPE